MTKYSAKQFGKDASEQLRILTLARANDRRAITHLKRAANRCSLATQEGCTCPCQDTFHGTTHPASWWMQEQFSEERYGQWAFGRQIEIEADKKQRAEQRVIDRAAEKERLYQTALEKRRHREAAAKAAWDADAPRREAEQTAREAYALRRMAEANLRWEVSEAAAKAAWDADAPRREAEARQWAQCLREEKAEHAERAMLIARLVRSTRFRRARAALAVCTTEWLKREVATLDRVATTINQTEAA